MSHQKVKSKSQAIANYSQVPTAAFPRESERRAKSALYSIIAGKQKYVIFFLFYEV